MKKLIHFIFDPKNEKLVLLLIPTLVLIIAGAVLIPQISEIVSIINSEKSASVQNGSAVLSTNIPESTISPALSPEPTTQLLPTPTSTPTANAVNVHITGVSVEQDMHIFARDDKENIIQGNVFNLIVTYPDGKTYSCSTDTDGSCYLTNLTPGKYTVSLEQKEGFSSASPITVDVKETVVFQKIENIEQIVEIKDISEGINEIKTNESPTAQNETTIDYVTSPPTETDNAGLQSNYMLDNNGNVIYQYEYHTDENGYLLDSSGNSTDVIPNIENGVLVCGLRLNAATNTYDTVTLFNSDNTPVSGYYIVATPVMKDSNYHSGWQNEGDNIVYYLDGEKAKGLKNIDGKLYYFDGNGVRAKTVGCDVSFYNGNIDWNAVKNAGIEFAIIRIGFRGWGSAAVYQDTCFEQNLRNAKNAGIKVGVYFYSSAVNKKEAVEEASICLDWMRGQSLDFPIYLDMEFSGDYPNGRADKLSSSARVEIIQAFCETVKSGGYQAGLYSTQTFLRDEINLGLVSQYSIWMASFTDNYVVPNVNYRYDIWQFTDFGKVAGINGAVDFNVIR